MLPIGNFADYQSTELVRGISIAIDFRLMTSPSGLPMSTLATDVVIATLSSDIKLGILFRGSDRRLTVSYLTASSTWSTFSGTASTLQIDLDTVYVINFTRSISDPRHMTVTYST